LPIVYKQDYKAGLMTKTGLKASSDLHVTQLVRTLGALALFARCRCWGAKVII